MRGQFDFSMAVISANVPPLYTPGQEYIDSKVHVAICSIMPDQLLSTLHVIAVYTSEDGNCPVRHKRTKTCLLHLTITQQCSYDWHQRGEKPACKEYVVDAIQAGEQHCIQLLHAVVKNYIQSKLVNSKVQVQCFIQPQ